MDLMQAIILAIIEGITEFLPISSTGHMVIASSIMGISQNEFTKIFTVFLGCNLLAFSEVRGVIQVLTDYAVLGGLCISDVHVFWAIHIKAVKNIGIQHVVSNVCTLLPHLLNCQCAGIGGYKVVFFANKVNQWGSG